MRMLTNRLTLVLAIFVLLLAMISLSNAGTRPVFNPVFHWDNPYTGKPLSGGLIYFYDDGVETPADVWQDADGGTVHAWPVVLDASGNAKIYGDDRTYDIIVKDENGVQLESMDDIKLFSEVSEYAAGVLSVTNVIDLRTLLKLGTVATLDAGVDSLDAVQLDADRKLPKVNASQLTGFTDNQIRLLPRSYLSGFNVSNSGTLDIAISAGACRDVNDSTDIILSAALIKQLDAGWVAGSGGGLESGEIDTDEWYHIYAISCATNADVMFSPIAPSGFDEDDLPGGYTYWRRIASIVTSASGEDICIEQFQQFGDEFYWDVPKLDVDPAGTSNLGVDVVTFGLNYIPDGIQVKADLSCIWYRDDVKSAGFNVFPTSITSLPPMPSTVTALWLMNVADDDVRVNTGYEYDGSKTLSREKVWTDTDAEFNAQANFAGGYFSVVTIGWTDRRGRDD